ncbi:hypothetical protein AAC387_Pa10g2056 [Persea americana]
MHHQPSLFSFFLFLSSLLPLPHLLLPVATAPHHPTTFSSFLFSISLPPSFLHCASPQHPSLPCPFSPATLHLSGPLHLSHAIPIFLVCPLCPLSLLPSISQSPAQTRSSSSAPCADPPLPLIFFVLPLHLYRHRTVLLLEGDMGGGEALVVEEEGLDVVVLGVEAIFKDLGGDQNYVSSPFPSGIY